MSPRLATTYLGLRLRNPLIASSSPLTGRLDTLLDLDEAGVGAVVLPSLFEEQIEREELVLDDLSRVGHEISPEVTGYFDPFTGFEVGADDYLRHLSTAKSALSVPVIASLNGYRPGGWTHHAKQLEAAGADAIELNVYFLATDPDVAAADVEQRTIDTVAEVAGSVHVPVSVKLGPWFSSIPHLVQRLAGAGAQGVVLFNRFYQPDVDLDELTVGPHLILSSSQESRLALRWIAILRGRVRLDLAGSGGVHTADDVVKLLLVGADAVTMASALLEHGPEHVAQVLADLETWMRENDYDDVMELRGALSQRSAPDPEAFERANYLKTLTGYSFGYRVGG
ncbi:MAG: dihydroorotate dehydrogenase-like protein [Trueperaceae bacterium]|nr:dihydroorotate dehydrogenase-like protein [Truepera sp.]HRN17976.1 dihydroorotate dehydrogenase-like protein [Trueperaceae bacterium]HRQ09574.1 dihydroorotate dehydrogenase-like protein [Trueperaceae bacterium]